MKTIVVTGASGGIGSAIVSHFSNINWQVVAVDIATPSAPSDKSKFIQCDLSDAAQVDKLAHDISSDHPSIDAIINCAAAQNVSPLTQLTNQEWDETFAVNVRAPWQLIKGLHRPLSEPKSGANIINISSIHSRVTSKGMAAYASSKAALNGLTRAVSIEFAPDKIRANAIILGAVKTPMLVDHLNDKQIELLISKQLIPDLIEPQAIVGMIDYLLSSAADNITGQEFVIDSGVLPQLATEID